MVPYRVDNKLLLKFCCDGTNLGPSQLTLCYPINNVFVYISNLVYYWPGTRFYRTKLSVTDELQD